MTKNITILVWCLLMAAATAKAQEWAKVPGLPESEFTVIEDIGGILYAVSGNNLYTSSNGGGNWQGSAFTTQEDIFVYTLQKFGDKIYAGTSIGIFSAAAAHVHQPWNHDINTLAVTSFAEYGGVLYASVEAFGVIKLMGGTAWIGFSYGLPSFSMTVNKLLATPAGLIAFAGSNGTFYRYNFQTANWDVDYYYGGISAGLDAEDAEIIGNTLYISRYNNILRSDDLGNNWVQDRQGLNVGQNRKLYVGNAHLYSITLDGEDNTYLSKRLKTETGTSWAPDTEYMAFYTYSILEHGETLFAAAFDGLYSKGGTLVVEKPARPAEPTVYPNPSANGIFNLTHESTIDKLTVYDAMGRLVLQRDKLPANNIFYIPGQGIFIIKIYTGGTTYTYKVISGE